MNREWLFQIADPPAMRDVWTSAFGAAWANRTGRLTMDDLYAPTVWKQTRDYCEKVADDAVKAFVELTEKKPDDNIRR